MVMQVVVVEQDEGLGVHRVRLRDRLRARMRSAALDRQLARGASPESSVALAVRAGYLCDSGQRRLLARSLTRITEAADGAGRLKAPLSRSAIHCSERELAALVDRLEAAAPVSVQGVARVRSLLTDGTGPLYQGAPSEQLGLELRARARGDGQLRLSTLAGRPRSAVLEDPVELGHGERRLRHRLVTGPEPVEDEFEEAERRLRRPGVADVGDRTD